jgi:CheY-like chemotaxis protein
LAGQVQPDLIISDINLSGTSGLVLCDEIKRQPGLAAVPVMFLSAAQTPDIIRRSHAAGGAYYLRKPFDPQVILELIDKALPHAIGAPLAQA